MEHPDGNYEENSSSNKTKSGGRSSGGNSSGKKYRTSQAKSSDQDYNYRASQGGGSEGAGGGGGGGRRVSIGRGKAFGKNDDVGSSSDKTKSSKSSGRDNKKALGKKLSRKEAVNALGELDERKTWGDVGSSTGGDYYLEELTPIKAQGNQPVIEPTDAYLAFSIFRLSNPNIVSSPPKNKGGDDDKQSNKSSKGSKGDRAPPPSSVEEEFYESESLELNDDQAEELTSFEEDGGYSYNDRRDYGDSSEEGEGGEEEGMVAHKKSRGTMMREKWEEISEIIMRTWNSPCRVFKLRGYHSEPDLTIPFEDKFDPKLEAFEGKDGLGKWKKFQEKYVSCEDIVMSSGFGREHPDLVRGVLSEVKLRSYAIDENMKNSWWELYDWERKRFSFFDELFAMGYVVDSLEVLSPPPRGEDGVAITTGEYFVEAEERHFRKKVDYGRVVFKTKHVYTGNFQDWYFEGPGRYCWQDGTVYQGEFSGGLMNGPGSIHWPDGCIYEGHFIYGKRSGFGVYSSADGQNTYAGDWLNGLPHGHGKMWYDPEDDDNDYYEGQWERGLPQGVGTRQYSTGDRYVGNWVEGMRNGYGIMIWLQERQVFKGEWLDGVPHGFGKHIWYLERTPTNNFPARHVYQGNWVEGKREGIGKMVYPCGSVYEGRWKNGQRHGKGMFINPAGDILVGLFRAGSILGGSDVPLHAPTYECDFAGLTEWMVARFKLKLVGGAEDNKEEEQLLEITKQYLPFIRKLYHRAGEYSHKYGKHGLYPAYMKKTSENVKAGSKLTKDCVPPPSSSNASEAQGPGQVPHDTKFNVGHHREYSRLDEPEHMKGKLEKPESLDGVNPVTRFGLWLLLRDCDGVLDEATMAYFDKLWCETPPLSFQTRHNPFEPVYLWQFLQALIVAAVAYFVDIPRIRQHDQHQDKKSDGGMEPEAVSDTTLRGGMSFAEQRRVEITRLRRQNAQMQMQMQVQSSKYLEAEDDTKTVGGKKSKHHKGGKSQHNGGKGDEDAKTVKTGKRDKNAKVHGGGDQGGVPQQSKISTISTIPVEDQVKGSSSSQDDGGGEEKNLKVKKVAPAKRTSKNSKNSNKSSGKASGGNKKNKKSKDSKFAEDILVAQVAMEEIEEEDDEEVEEYFEDGRQEEGEEGDEDEMEEEEEEDGDDSPGMGRKSVLFRREAEDEGKEDYTEPSSPYLSGYSISECFESFLYKKLLPCLRRDPGCNLPVMPQPLPALVDMYDAFKAIKERDIIRGKEFLRAAVPHLMFPPRKEALWWHRCPEPLSHQIDLDELMEKMHQKFDTEEVEDYGQISGGGKEVGKGAGGDFEEKFESEYLGTQAQNSETTLRLLKLCRDDPLHPECHALGALKGEGVGHIPTLPIVNSSEILKDLQGTESEEEMAPMSEYITEGNPFAEDDLVPEPFLWADDYKCIPIRKKYQHFENINTQDVFNVIHQLYPKLCRGKHENNLQFELIFCDWLWCVSILAKTSTEREVRDAWKTKSKDAPPRIITNPQSLGVYAHYIKQIKNNPYLSPTPPPDFKPKIKPKLHDDEKKAVKFQSIH